MNGAHFNATKRYGGKRGSTYEVWLLTAAGRRLQVPFRVPVLSRTHVQHWASPVEIVDHLGTGILSGYFCVARNPTRIEGKCGDHFLQADLG